MEAILKILKAFFSNALFDITLILAILMKILYPKFRGFMGEFWVSKQLKKLPKEEYKILNNVMIKNNNTTYQIDHIVVSKYGIFVIEMKNYYGLIVGEEYQNNWIQYLGKNKNYFKNPIHQNYGHVKALQELLNLKEELFIPIVCFSNQAKVKVKTKSIVTYLDNINKNIKKYNIEQLDNIDDIVNVIINNNITDKKLRKEHVKKIKTKIENNNIKVDNMICPKCGNTLVEKSGKYGTFIGCSNYPKCKYIKK